MLISLNDSIKYCGFVLCDSPNTGCEFLLIRGCLSLMSMPYVSKG